MTLWKARSTAPLISLSVAVTDGRGHEGPMQGLGFSKLVAVRWNLRSARMRDPMTLEKPRVQANSKAATCTNDLDIVTEEENTLQRVQLLERCFNDWEASGRCAGSLTVAVAEENYTEATRLRDLLAGVKSQLTPGEQFVLTNAAKLRNGSLEQRMTAIASMGGLGDPHTLPMLFDGLRDSNPLIFDQTEKAMWKIIMRSGREDVDRRLQGGRAHGKIRPKAAKQVVKKVSQVVGKMDSTAHPGGGCSPKERGAEMNFGHHHDDKGGVVEEWEDSGGAKAGEWDVHCQVETVSWRERHISASVCIAASEARVWEVLTDYERLAEFIPNLIRSERIPCPHPGRIWLLQEGMQAAMYWQIEARVVLDLLELPLLNDGKELRFSMVDGDFKRYVGRWYLRPGPRPGTTVLHYEVNVTPRLLFPAAFVEKIIKADLPVNLRAMAERAEADCTTWLKIPSCGKPNLPGRSFSFSSFFEKLGPDKSGVMVSSTAGSAPQSLQPPTLKDDSVSSTAVGPALVGFKEETRWGDRDQRWGGVGMACRLGRPCAVDEVHLRRFDDLLENGGVHRRVVAAITVEAHIHDVWSVLTAYESLPEFIPNLAVSHVLSREKNKVRLLQEGCKCLLYMVLHARVVLDLWERPQYEIVFQQVEGDFDSFQGKWTLEPLGTQHTLLKYVVDTKMHKDSLLAEAIVEEVIYEDLPANLCAIRDRVELREQETLEGLHWPDPPTNKTERESGNDGSTPLAKECQVLISNPVKAASGTVQNLGHEPPRGRRRPLVAGLQRDFNVLERELLNFIAEEGKQGVMPMRCELRDGGRVDLEKAIARMGGFGPIAARLNLQLAYKERKPRGYWDDLQNIHKEILMFQKEYGKDKTYMPTRKSLERAGRYGLARSLEKWGGLQEVARILGLKVRKRQKYPSSKVELPTQPQKVISEDESNLKLPLKTSLPAESTKWITMRRGFGSDLLDM